MSQSRIEISNQESRRRRPTSNPRLRPRSLCAVGRRILKRSPREAMRLFAKARAMDPTKPIYASYLGLSMTMLRNYGNDGIRLCEMAVRTGAYDATLYHNLGRAYLISGERLKARQAFLTGLRIDESDRRIGAALMEMGYRRPPVFPSLPRSHRFNRMAGRFLSRMEMFLGTPEAERN